jgi:hypothetical protein
MFMLAEYALTQSLIHPFFGQQQLLFAKRLPASL